MLKIKDLSNDWGRFQLKNINLEIKEGEFLIVLGPSGAGKTLLLETIAGFTIPDEGKIIRKNKEITNSPPEKRDIGFVYQDFALFPHLSVRENIEFGLEKEEYERVNDLACFLGIDHLLDEDPITLSGGEKQRITLARALATDPELMLFDEPLSSLDERIQKKMRREIKRIHEERNLTSIYVTHNQNEAMFLADRIAVMIDGTIVQTGEPEEIFYNPSNNEIAEFVGVENIYKGTITNKNQSLAKISVKNKFIEAITDLEEKKDVRVMVRPEEVIIKKKEEESSARNQFRGEITKIIDEGPIVKIEIDCGFNIISNITRRSYKDMNLSIGEKVHCSFKASSVHVI